ncbi:uncharacterized protein TNCV_5094091 [Trichonephila clavipes]|nr:uncharacterized protein TNCV_5094091 [Trichonephila clavipes]
MERFTDTELADMLLIFGLAERNARAALRLYLERYPRRDASDSRMFADLHHNLCESVCFQVRGCIRALLLSSCYGFEFKTDFIQSILEFQECDEEDVETWMAYEADDCEFQMLHDDGFVTSVQKESDPVDDETDENEDNNNNESSKGSSNADTFPALETAMEWYEQQSECCPTQLLLLNRIKNIAVKKRRSTMVQRKINGYFPQRSVRFHILHRSHSIFAYPNNRISEQCPVPIDSDKRRSTTAIGSIMRTGHVNRNPNIVLGIFRTFYFHLAAPARENCVALLLAACHNGYPDCTLSAAVLPPFFLSMDTRGESETYKKDGTDKDYTTNTQRFNIS